MKSMGVILYCDFSTPRPFGFHRGVVFLVVSVSSAFAEATARQGLVVSETYREQSFRESATPRPLRVHPSSQRGTRGPRRNERKVLLWPEESGVKHREVSPWCDERK